MSVYQTERFLQDREVKRNNKITKSLKGRLRPSDEDIIKNLKRRKYTYEQSGEVE